MAAQISDQVAAVLQAREWLSKDPLFLDSETTGLADNDQVIQIGVVDMGGNVLIDEMVKPTVPIHPKAVATHGITTEMLANCPPFSEIWPRLAPMIEGRHVIMYNAPFDTGKIRHTAAVQGVLKDGFEFFPHCAMELFSAFYGEWNEYYGSYRWQKLSTAAAHFSIENPAAHSAAGDAETTRRVMIALAAVKVSKQSAPVSTETLNTLEEMLRQLAKARNAYEQYDSITDAMIEQVRQSDNYVGYCALMDEAKKRAEQLTDEIKRLAVAQFDGQHKRPLPGVQIKERTRASIVNVEEARKYAVEQAQAFLKLDFTGLEKLAIKLADTPHHLSFALVSKEITAEIASDLSDYLPKPQADKQPDDEIPF